MTDEQALLAAILAEPDEDTPRLAYADWLDEHGDGAGRARAEFIRAQVEAERLPADDRRRKQHESRAAELLRRHAGAWAAPLQQASGGGTIGHAFSRGFISALHGSEADIARTFPAVASLCPIQQLSVEWKAQDAPADFDAVGACPSLAHLRRLEYTRFSEQVIRPVLSSPHLTGLRSLRLRWGWLEGAVELAAGSAVAGSLRELWVWDSGVGVVTPGAGLGTLVSAEWPALEVVRIDNFAVGNDGVRLLAAEFAARGRRQLHVSGQALTAVGLRPAVEAVLPGGLDSLSLAYSARRDEEPRQLPRGARELRLGGFFNDGDAIVGWLVAAVPPGRFDRLALIRCRISRAGARTLAAWPGLAHLKELDLSDNWIGDGGAKDLAQSPHLTALEALFVAHNDITKTGKDALKARFGRRVRVS